MADQNLSPDRSGDAEIAGVVIRRPEWAAAPPEPPATPEPTAPLEPVPAATADDRVDTAAFAAAPDVSLDMLVGEAVIGGAANGGADERVSTSRRRRVSVPRVVAIAATAAMLLGVGGVLGMSPDSDPGDPVTVAAAPPVIPSEAESSTAQQVSPSEQVATRETGQSVSRDSTRVAPRTSNEARKSETSSAPARPSTSAAAASSSAATTAATSAASAPSSPSESPSDTPSESSSQTPSGSPTEKGHKGKSPSPTPSESPTDPDDGDSDDESCLLGICW